MSETVERVAKAIANSSVRVQLTNEQLRMAANAAIEAMPEPTYEVSLRECSDAALRREVIRRGLI